MAGSGIMHVSASSKLAYWTGSASATVIRKYGHTARARLLVFVLGLLDKQFPPSPPFTFKCTHQHVIFLTPENAYATIKQIQLQANTSV